MNARAVVDATLNTIAGGIPDDIRADYLARYDGERFAESMLYARSYPEQLPALAELLPQIATPVTIIAGRHDRVVPLPARAARQAMREGFRSSRPFRPTPLAQPTLWLSGQRALRRALGPLLNGCAPIWDQRLMCLGVGRAGIGAGVGDGPSAAEEAALWAEG
jgi:pimeloyl-ACP methyl ester carboxylesterase